MMYFFPKGSKRQTHPEHPGVPYHSKCIGGFYSSVAGEFSSRKTNKVSENLKSSDFFLPAGPVTGVANSPRARGGAGSPFSWASSGSSALGGGRIRSGSLNKYVLLLLIAPIFRNSVFHKGVFPNAAPG